MHEGKSFKMHALYTMNVNACILAVVICGKERSFFKNLLSVITIGYIGLVKNCT